MKSKTYTYCVYVLEIDGDPNYVYVGQTAHTPEKRLEQHQTGYKSAPSLKKAKKLALRPDIYKQFDRVKTREAAEALESLVAKHLVARGFKVEGGH